MESAFETFEHGADVGIRGYGKTPEEALSNLLKALATLMVEKVAFLRDLPTVSFSLDLDAEFLDELLVIFINKVLSISSLEGILIYDFRGKLLKDKTYKLIGEILGRPFDFESHGYGVEVKGATFTLTKFEKVNDIYVAQCVVDV